MKTNGRIIILVLAAAMLSFASAGAVYANSGYPLIVEQLLEQARGYFETGKADKAIRDYNKVLMLDRGNVEALEHLQWLSRDGALYDRARISSHQISDLTRHIIAYKDMMDYLEGQKNAAHYKVNNIQTEHNDLHDSVVAKEQELSLMKEKVSSMKAATQKLLEERNSDIREVANRFIKREEKLKLRLAIEVHAINQHNAQLALKYQGITDIEDRYEKTLESSMEYQNKLAALKEEYNQVRSDLFKTKEQRDVMFKELEDYVYIRSQEIGRLEDELIKNKVDLVKNETAHVLRIDDLSRMNESLEEYNGWVESRDGLIKEKNEQITLLMERLDDIETRMNGIL